MRHFQLVLAGALPALAVLWIGCAPAAPSSRTYPMGERVTTGALVYNVFETTWKAQFGDGQQARVPKERFLLVRLSVANGGAAEAMVPTLTLVDDAGQTFDELSDGDGVTAWLGYLRHVKPAENLVGNIVFDVAPKHYRLRVSDESGQKTGEVDLPLSFGSENPQIPPPVQ